MKKASIDISLNQVIGLVLGVMVILGSSYVALKFLGIIGSESDNEQSITFRDNLVRNMELLKQSEDKKACYMLGSLDSADGIFLFDGDAKTLNQECGIDEEVNRPGSCGPATASSYGCICLCDVDYQGADDNDCSDDGYCTRISSFKKFYYPSHDNANIDQWWELFSEGIYVPAHIYGHDCGGNVWASGPQYYVLEKNTDDSLIISRIPKVEKSIDISIYKYKNLGVIPLCTSLDQNKQRLTAK